MQSAPIASGQTSSGKKIYVTFTHTDNDTVIGEISAEGIFGNVRTIRKTENEWVPLSDTLDRVALFMGSFPHPLTVNLEAVFQKYCLDKILT